MLKIILDSALETIFVPRPRKSKPITPELSTSFAIASTYVMESSDVCLNVFTTRMPLEQQSETTDAQKPISALRVILRQRVDAFGRTDSR
mmetsp:Transcript_27415/g.40222  ORF Transcript_27415/g.40222 Transcript_27415/m.40222 type:complete len:90 (-) Transcript_27415:105-374(-)